MKKLWKRNIAVVVVVMFVCVAAYLNWSYSKSSTDVSDAEEVSVEETATRTLGEAVLVNSTEDAGTAVSTGDTDDSSYFDEARLDREQARDSALSILQETVDDASATDEARNAAAEAITVMAQCSLMESEIEGLISAKGYTSCVAYVNDESASIVVGTGGTALTDTDVAIITDIVIDETGLSASQIKVIETTETEG